MRKLLLLFVFLAFKSWTQNKQPYELGVNVFNLYTKINPIGLPSDRDIKTEYCNGVFFRYDTNQFVFRAQVNYRVTNGSIETPSGFSEFYSLQFNGTAYSMQLGYQKKLLEKKDWLYAFADIGYSRKSEQGISRGGWSGISEQYVQKSNGLLLDLGIGSRFQLYRQIYFSPELNYTSEIYHVDKTITPLSGGKFKEYRYYSFYLRPWLRCYLTFSF